MNISSETATQVSPLKIGIAAVAAAALAFTPMVVGGSPAFGAESNNVTAIAPMEIGGDKGSEHGYNYDTWHIGSVGGDAALGYQSFTPSDAGVMLAAKADVPNGTSTQLFKGNNAGTIPQDHTLNKTEFSELIESLEVEVAAGDLHFQIAGNFNGAWTTLRPVDPHSSAEASDFLEDSWIGTRADTNTPNTLQAFIDRIDEFELYGVGVITDNGATVKSLTYSGTTHNFTNVAIPVHGQVETGAENFVTDIAPMELGGDGTAPGYNYHTWHIGSVKGDALLGYNSFTNSSDGVRLAAKSAVPNTTSTQLFKGNHVDSIQSLDADGFQALVDGLSVDGEGDLHFQIAGNYNGKWTTLRPVVAHATADAADLADDLWVGTGSNTSEQISLNEFIAGLETFEFFGVGVVTDLGATVKSITYDGTVHNFTDQPVIEEPIIEEPGDGDDAEGGSDGSDGSDAGSDADGSDAGSDAGGSDAGSDAGSDSDGSDAGSDADGSDAGADADGSDAGSDGSDADGSDSDGSDTDKAPKPTAPVAPPAVDTAALNKFIAEQGLNVAATTASFKTTGDTNNLSSLNPSERLTGMLPWANEVDSFVDVYVYSTPVHLGTFPVVNGQVVLSADISGLAPGAHHLVFVGQTSGDVQVANIAVQAAAVPGQPIPPVAIETGAR